MKTSIIISGQIGGNYLLKNALNSDDLLDTKNLMFNNFELVYMSKSSAKKALWEGFKYLKTTLDNPMIGCITGLRYDKYGALYYDASQAKIQ